MKSVLYKLAYLCASVFIYCALPSKLLASHFAAIDLYVTYVGDQTGCSATGDLVYEVTLDIYGNCGTNSASLGANPGPTARIRIQSENAGYDETIETDVPERDTVDELCPTFKPLNSCRVPANANFQAYARDRYKYLWTAPSQQEDWKFSWNNSARNGVLNLQRNFQSIYVECGLNNLVKPYNSTPRFTVSPLPYICQGQPAFYLNGPIDPNKDSMRVSTVYPLAWNGTAVDTLFYGSCACTLNDPIGSDPGNPYNMNPITGTASYTPLNVGQYILAFRCDEYEPKTGKKLGYITRDVQISIFACNTPPPPIDQQPQNIQDGIFVTKGTGEEEISALYVCPGANLSFVASAASTDPNAQLYLESNAGVVIPGANFDIPASGAGSNGTPAPRGTFSWIPTNNDLGDHTLIIAAKDSTCSGNGFALILKNYQVVLIKVVPGLDAGADLPICAINPQPRQLFVKGADGLSVIWTDIDGSAAKNLSADNITNPVASPIATTDYVVYTDDLVFPCRNRDTVSVFVDTSNSLQVFPKNPLVLCRPDYLQLDAIVKGAGPITNMTCGINNKFTNPECTETDSVAIYGSAVYGRIAYDSTGGAPVLDNMVKTSKIQFLINRADMREYGMNSSTIKSISFETAKNGDANYQYANFKIGMKCTSLESLDGSNGFQGNVTNVYSASGLLAFPDGKHEFSLDYPYNWDTTQNLLVEICYSNNPAAFAGNCVNPTTPQPPVIKYAGTIGGATISYVPLVVDLDNIPNMKPDTNALDVCGTLQVNKEGDRVKTLQLRPVVGFKYCDAPSLPYTISWKPGMLLSDSTILQPLAYVPQSTKYILELYGRSGCIVRDSVDIYVPTHDFSVWPKDTAICLGETAPMQVKNGFAAIWHEYVDGEYRSAANSLSCTDCLYPVANPKVTTTYKVEIADSVWCFDTLEVTVNVLPLPAVSIITPDTIVKYGKSVQLMAKGARIYNWMPPSTLNNANTSYPVATPTEPTDYIVTGIGANGCRTRDTVRVGIDYRNSLMIPSAFTPNSDGKNDVFRIANLTFQRVMEFRVFNRWGQEVFTGNTNNGWDGKWKGVEQDMGNYQYLIRLGYPDGYVETYKGEVTLVK